MDGAKISDRTRRQLEQLPPEKREKAQANVARTQTPEYRAREAADREALDREQRETGRIATVKGSLAPADLDRLREFLGSLRRERESLGLSLSDLAERTGIDKAALSRLENGLQVNPTLATLTRYARALDKQLAWSLVDAPGRTVVGR
jgi:ribosome-binding protein aMBF1 (putative translation factor)